MAIRTNYKNMDPIGVTNSNTMTTVATSGLGTFGTGTGFPETLASARYVPISESVWNHAIS